MGYSVRDIVRKIDTYWHGDLNESRDELGRLYVISEVHGSNNYEIRDLINGGTSAWWHDSQLEYVGRADKDIFDKLDAIQGELHKRNTSLAYIKTNYPHIATGSWLKLFDEIKYNCSFNRNGEYFVLACDIQTLKPVFDAIFDQDLRGALENVDKVFKESFRETYRNNVRQFFNKIYEIN